MDNTAITPNGRGFGMPHCLKDYFADFVRSATEWWRVARRSMRVRLSMFATLLGLRGVARVAAMISMALVANGCCKGGLRSVTLSLGTGAVSTPSYAWVGDVVTLSAVAGTEPEEFCYHTLYTSATEPGRFVFQSSDSAVAIVGPNGTLRANRVGATTLTAVSAEVKSEPLPLIVAPPVASIRLMGTHTTLSVGDTVLVHVDALDAAGQPVLGAQLQYSLLRPQDSVVTIGEAPPQSTAPATTFATPAAIRLDAKRSGTAVLTVRAPHDLLPLARVVTSSLSIVVVAR